MYDKNKTSKDSELYGRVDDSKSGIGRNKYEKIYEKIYEKMIELDRKFNEKEISWEEYSEKIDALGEEIENV